jgi:hypothetical protein
MNAPASIETPRANRREVRNPVLALPAARRIMELDEGTRGVLRELFLDLKAAAAAKADECFRRHKWPIAVYWKAVGVYAGHIARVLK